MTGEALALGVSIDGYAVEGGYDVEGGPATSFGVAQSLGRSRASLRSQGTFEHLDDLVDRAASLGFGEVRLTLEWARLEPRPGSRDEAALEVYARALDVASRASLDVSVVLCDAAWPSWLGQEPWLSAWAPEAFADHAGWVAGRLAERVATVVTFRAPNRAADDGWRSARRPPYRRGAHADATSALDGMLVAHQQATCAIAAAAPGVRRAIILEAAADYDNEGLWRDLSGGVSDPVVLGARRARHERGLPRRGRRHARADAWARRPPIRSTAPLRSARHWDATPDFEWWLSGSDEDLLAATLEHADGRIDTVELCAPDGCWDALVATVERLLVATPGLRGLQLHGLVASTGPLDVPIGLVALDQHGGAWTLAATEPAIARAIEALTSLTA